MRTTYTNSRQRIFEAAKTVLVKEGVSGLSMRRIAQCSGMAPMSLYRHFADKDALLDALMEDGLAAWGARVRTIPEQAPLPWLERLAQEFLGFALEEPHRFDAAFLLRAPKARQYPHDFAAGRSPVIAQTVAVIEQAKSEGYFEGHTAPGVALTVSGLAQGLVSMHRAGRFTGDQDFTVLYREIVRGALKALSRPAKGRGR